MLFSTLVMSPVYPILAGKTSPVERNPLVLFHPALSKTIDLSLTLVDLGAPSEMHNLSPAGLGDVLPKLRLSRDKMTPVSIVQDAELSPPHTVVILSIEQNILKDI